MLDEGHREMYEYVDTRSVEPRVIVFLFWFFFLMLSVIKYELSIIRKIFYKKK